MFSKLADDVVVKILALGTAWPHAFVRLTCVRFNRLSHAFREAASDETLVVSVEDVDRTSHLWLLDRERGCWVGCACPRDPPTCITAGTASRGEVILSYWDWALDQGGILAFNPKKNAWRELPKPPMGDCSALSTLEDQRVVALEEKACFTRHTRKMAIWDGETWAAVPDIPSVTDFEEHLGLGAVGHRIYVWTRRVIDVMESDWSLQYGTTLYIYDTANGTWTESNTFLADNRKRNSDKDQLEFTVVKGRLYSIELQEDRVLISIYDPATDVVTEVPLLNSFPSWFWADDFTRPAFKYTACAFNDKLTLLTATCWPPGYAESSFFDAADPQFALPALQTATLVQAKEHEPTNDWDNRQDAAVWDETLFPPLFRPSKDTLEVYERACVGVALSP